MQLTDLAKPVRPSSEDYREGNYKPNLPDPFQSESQSILESLWDSPSLLCPTVLSISNSFSQFSGFPPSWLVHFVLSLFIFI